MDEKIKGAFKKIVEDLTEIAKAESEGISDPDYLLLYPRSVFMDALAMLKEEISVGEAIDKGLGNIFLQVIDDSSAEIRKRDRSFFLEKKKKNNKERASWITQKVLRGAYGHEKNQPRDAY